MPRDASELARRLARDAEAVCRHYLSKGRRQGRYWTVGDVRNTPGRSMFVRLSGPDCGPGAAGHWTDAASAEHGDLLDVIRESCGLVEFRDVAEEARRFLSLPRAEPPDEPRPPAPTGSPEAARRLWAMSQADRAAPWPRRIYALAGSRICGVARRCASTLAAGIVATRTTLAIGSGRWPALIAAVTAPRRHDHRRAPYLARPRVELGKAPVATPRRAMGLLLGNAVRFGRAVRRHGRRRRARNDPVASRSSCLPCRWRPRSPPTTSPPSIRLPACVGSTSPATTIPQDIVR